MAGQLTNSKRITCTSHPYCLQILLRDARSLCAHDRDYSAYSALHDDVQEVNSLELDSAIPDGVLAHSESEARLLCARAHKHHKEGSIGSIPPPEAAIIKYLDMSSTQLASAVDKACEVYLYYRDSPLSHVQDLQHRFETAEQLFPTACNLCLKPCLHLTAFVR